MKDTEILQKAIGTATKNGWKPMGKLFAYVPNNEKWLVAFTLELVKARTIKGILFDHDFAKAFWREEEISSGEYRYFTGFDEGCYSERIMPAWRHHLQQMVLEENPIKYLEKYLD